MKKLNVIGSKFGMLQVISQHSTTRNGHIRYVCKCDCGNTCNVLLTHLRQGNTKHCGCNRPIGKTHSQWTGFGEISGNFWYNRIIRSANGNKGRRNSVELSITKEYAWNLFLEQNRKCALSGIDLVFPKRNKDKGYNASLDRIDSALGYIEGNVQWVDKTINIMKNKFNQEYFIEMCKKVAENN